MSVLKYKDPETGEYKITRTVKVVGEGGAAEQLTASGYPDYIAPEVVDMVERVRAVRKDNSIVLRKKVVKHLLRGGQQHD